LKVWHAFRGCPEVAALRCAAGRRGLALIVFLCAGAVGSAAANAPLHAPPPLKIDLNQFDALKKTTLLPNGQLLAYIDMGKPDGRPVVLIRLHR
jgi:hypothetical protein